MNFSITEADIQIINDTLGVKSKSRDDSHTWALKNSKNDQSIVFTLYNKVVISPKEGATGVLISAQTKHGYFELHDINAFMIFEPDEIIFVRSFDDKVSCLVIGKNCNCSMYSNIDKNILNTNFTELDPAILLSAMQLSLTESII